MIQIINIFQTTKPSSLSEEIVVLLKGQGEEILGGISIDVHHTVSYITRFWLKPQIRGYSFGSILLHEAFKQLQASPSTTIRMGTHIPYIQHILMNNRFERYEEFTVNNTTYSFFQLPKHKMNILTFTHDFEPIPYPSAVETEQFFSLYLNGAINTYGVLKPYYIRFERDMDDIGFITAYYGNQILAVDQVMMDYLDSRVTKLIKQYALSLNISHLHYLNGPADLFNEEPDAGFKQSLQFV